MWRTDHVLGSIYSEILKIWKGLQPFNHHMWFVNHGLQVNSGIYNMTVKATRLRINLLYF